MYRLNKEGYSQLIEEDIAWLEKIPRTLEREHIIAVLKASVEHEYPSLSSSDFLKSLHPGPCEEHGEDCPWDHK